MRRWGHGPYTRPGAWRVFTLVGALYAASCADTAERALGPDAGPAMTDVLSTSLLTVQVVAPFGAQELEGPAPIEGASVRVYGVVPQNGFVANTSQVVGLIDDGDTGANGKVTFDLPSGNYCISVRVVPPGWRGLNLVAPAETPDFDFMAPQYGPVVSVPSAQNSAMQTSSNPAFAPFTAAHFTRCYTHLPVPHGSQGTFVEVQLDEPFILNPVILDLNGDPLPGINVYAVMPVDVPWNDPANPDIRTAFFSFVARTTSNGEAATATAMALLGVAPGSSYALEFQQVLPGSPFNITGTVKNMTADPDGGSQAFSIEAAPLLCEQTLHEFPGRAQGIDFLRANFGYHAIPVEASEALVPDPSIVAIQLVHDGDGPVTVTFRTDLPNGRLTTTVDYTCEDGECSAASVKTPGKNGQSVEVFHMAKDDGTIKTTLVLLDVPAGHERVLWAARSPGDKIPLTARNPATDAFFIIDTPALCVIEESNDDKWAVGEI